MLPRVKIVGQRGSWMARAGGEELPVIHQHWRSGPYDYHDPMHDANIKGVKYRRFVDALASGDRCIVSKDRLDGETFVREGYIGVFTYTDLKIHPDGAVSLRLAGKVAEPAPR